MDKDGNQHSVWNGEGWVGEDDWLPAPPPKTPLWFKVVVALAVVGCLVGGAAVLLGWIR